MNLYNMILQELTSRRAANVELFPPYFACSIGCHVFNLYNQTSKIYTEHKQIPNMRLHLCLVARPGYGKTFWLTQFLRGEYCLLKDTGIKLSFEAAMTEAGFVGTVSSVDGIPVKTFGAAKLYDTAIVGIEEFSALTTMMKSQYGALLDTALLGALDSGWVYKRLAGGELHYQTHLTLWTGVQPARFDLSSGLGRRLGFLNYIPTEKDKRSIRLARRSGKNVDLNLNLLVIIQRGIRELLHEIQKVVRLEFDPEIYRFMDKFDIPPYEEALYERILLGYHLMSGNIESKTIVTLDEVGKQLCLKEMTWRDQIRRGSQFSEVISLIRNFGGAIEVAKLKSLMLQMELDWIQATKLIEDLVRIKAISIIQNKVMLREDLQKEDSCVIPE